MIKKEGKYFKKSKIDNFLLKREAFEINNAMNAMISIISKA